MRYLLLLRGINVGGKNKVSMAELKDLISRLGYENVITYINSGNIIFDANDNKETVRDKISHMLETFPFSIKIIIPPTRQIFKFFYVFLFCQYYFINFERI